MRECVHCWEEFCNKNDTFKASHWNSSNATHFLWCIWTRIAQAIFVEIHPLKCGNLLGCQWLTLKYRLCCRIFLNVLLLIKLVSYIYDNSLHSILCFTFISKKVGSFDGERFKWRNYTHKWWEIIVSRNANLCLL